MPEPCADPWAPVEVVRDVHNQLAEFEEAFYTCQAKLDGVIEYVSDQKDRLSGDK